MWGAAPTPAQVRVTERTIARRVGAERARVAKASLTLEQTATRLGMDQDQVTALLDAGELVGLDDASGAVVLPGWQFDDTTERGYLPGLARLRRCFPVGAASMTQWVSRRSADLGRRTPREALAAGDVDDVIAVACSLTAAGW